MKCMYSYNEIPCCKNTMPCPIKVNINTIELTVQTSGYCILDLLYVKGLVLRAVLYVELLNVCT